jgi:hypothetical protein
MRQPLVAQDPKDGFAEHQTEARRTRAITGVLEISSGARLGYSVTPSVRRRSTGAHCRPSCRQLPRTGGIFFYFFGAAPQRKFAAALCFQRERVARDRAPAGVVTGRGLLSWIAAATFCFA